jgi:radical SAM-linked protein
MEGDLRFLSHHDTLRALERAAARAGLPLRYSQGFNPHPVMALLPPRPVGVASRDDILVLSLEQPPDQADSGDGCQAARGEDFLAPLQAAAPSGMRFLRAVALEGKATPHPLRMHYRLPLKPGEVTLVSRRLEELAGLDRWVVSRLVSPKKARPARAMESRDIDIKPMVENPRLEAAVLRWSAVPHGDAWARPGELLRLLGLDERTNLAAVERTAVQYDLALQ